MKIGVVLSGCGVYDGSEIQETVFTLLSIDEHGASAVCMAPEIQQHHVINHLNGEEMPETRNVLIEAARIARGAIQPVSEIQANDLDALVLPGGFGAAKNLTKWAFSGPDGAILPEIQHLIREIHKQGKPIVGLCMGPTVIAKALEGDTAGVALTVGTTEESSPYDIAAISSGMEKTGAVAEMKTVREITFDVKNKIITAPCYMMDASISGIRKNISMAMDKLFEILSHE